MKILLIILSLLGSISLFLFGMKLMSEGLQKVTAVKLRAILSAFTSTKFKGILTGLTITSLIQSSSATTVMVMSFVNAGIVSLWESLAIIMGANIGTTITAWLVFFFGFKFNIASLALPIIGITFPFLFSPNSNRQRWGQTVMGFAIIFLGLNFIKDVVPDISTKPEILEFFGLFSDFGFGSVLIFCFIGFVFTAIIQSSSAAMALTLVLVDRGWFSFELASAMILGENIGTTITANIATIFANSTAKKAARSHFVINVIGVAGMFIIFYPAMKSLDWITFTLSGKSPYADAAIIPLSLAILHTLFNTINTIVLSPFFNFILKVSGKLVRDTSVEDESYTLRFLNTGMLSTSEISILQARKKLASYAKETMRMFKKVRQLFSETNDERFKSIFTTIKEYERLCDRYELEIANYLTKLSESDLSNPGSKRVRSMLKIVDDIESIGDTCDNIAKSLSRKKKEKIWFTQDIRNNTNAMFDLVEEAMDIMYNNLNMLYENVDVVEASLMEKKINKFKKQLRNEHISNLEKQSYTYQAGIIYTDLFSLCEQLGDFIINVSETIVESNQA